eukprot:scaffold33083_cov36-Phaeocystis_antarctica.AAC.3
MVLGCVDIVWGTGRAAGEAKVAGGSGDPPPPPPRGVCRLRIPAFASCVPYVPTTALMYVRTLYTFQPRAHRTYRVPYVPRTVRTAYPYRVARTPGARASRAGAAGSQRVARSPQCVAAGARVVFNILNSEGTRLHHPALPSALNRERVGRGGADLIKGVSGGPRPGRRRQGDGANGKKVGDGGKGALEATRPVTGCVRAEHAYSGTS